MLCCACKCDTDKLQAYDDHDELCALDKYRCMELSCKWCDLIDCEGLPKDTPHYNPVVGWGSDPGVTQIGTGYHRSSVKTWNKVDEKPRPPMREAFDPGDLDHSVDIPF